MVGEAGLGEFPLISTLNKDIAFEKSLKQRLTEQQQEWASACFKALDVSGRLQAQDPDEDRDLARAVRLSLIQESSKGDESDARPMSYAWPFRWITSTSG